MVLFSPRNLPVFHRGALLGSVQRYAGNFTVPEARSIPTTDNDYIASGFHADKKIQKRLSHFEGHRPVG